ncbi:MAG: amidohydrolase, partial [Muriicola sp.]
MKKYTFLGIALCLLFAVQAQKDTDDVLKTLDAKAANYGEIAQNIWEFAEMGYQEEMSSALLQSTLEKEGFTINKGIAGIPTAFVAEYGSGSPVIAVLG